MTPLIDLLFPVRGDALPTDHGYALYGAFSRIVPRFHAAGAEFRFAPIAGNPVAPGVLRLNSGSRLRLRLPQGNIRDALPLAGKRFDVDGHLIRLGVPAVAAIVPAAAVCGPFGHVQARGRTGAVPDDGSEETGRVGGPRRARHPGGRSRTARAGECRRRVVRLKGRTIIGYAAGGVRSLGWGLAEVAGVGPRRANADGLWVLPAGEGGRVMDPNKLWAKKPYAETTPTVAEHLPRRLPDCRGGVQLGRQGVGRCSGAERQHCGRASPPAPPGCCPLA